MTIAGHTFDSNDRCTCGRRWLDIIHCDEACVGQDGYAHTSYLSRGELDQILDERRRREVLYEAATRGASSGGYAAPPSMPDDEPDYILG